MDGNNSISSWFDHRLAEFLAVRIQNEFNEFEASSFVNEIASEVSGLSYSNRLSVFSKNLNKYLPADYRVSVSILVSILGDENPKETGMFKEFYWVIPIGKYISDYGLLHFEHSVHAISEITKRSTGEYAIRPFIERYPSESLKTMELWAKSENFHLRRLASEGLRPKLPWASRLTVFDNSPEKVFSILELLKEDEVLFVKRSVANHLTDWLKVNPEAVIPLIIDWKRSNNHHTQWIIKRATRKYPI